jgi:hypothetical protein
LSAPDSVLDQEGIHAKWKWFEQGRRALKFKALNAVMKVREYIQAFGQIPEYADLREELMLLGQARAAQYKAMVADPSIHRSLRADWMYRERFNLRPVDMELIRAVDRPDAHKPSAADGPRVAWGNYVRFLFEPLHLYMFSNLHPHRWLFIAENKSLPGRDAPKPGQVIGRPLSIVWYEKASDEDVAECDDVQVDEVLLVPTASDGHCLPICDISLGELSLAAGYYPDDILAEHTERDVELLHESRFLNHGVLHFPSRYAGIILAYFFGGPILDLVDIACAPSSRTFESPCLDVSTTVAFTKIS